MIHENAEDRKAQTEVVNVVKEFLSGLPLVGTDLMGESWFELKESKEKDHESHDFEVWHQGRYIAVGEIKCRNGKYRWEYFKENGWMIARERLTKLRQHDKDGKHVMLVLRTSDGFVMYTMLKTLMENYKLLKKAPDGWCKTDHGTKPKDEHGLIIPPELLRKAGQCATG